MQLFQIGWKYPKMLNFFFFSLRGSPDWSTGRKARQFRALALRPSPRPCPAPVSRTTCARGWAFVRRGQKVEERGFFFLKRSYCTLKLSSKRVSTSCSSSSRVTSCSEATTGSQSGDKRSLCPFSSPEQVPPGCLPFFPS